MSTPTPTSTPTSTEPSSAAAEFPADAVAEDSSSVGVVDGIPKSPPRDEDSQFRSPTAAGAGTTAGSMVDDMSDNRSLSAASLHDPPADDGSIHSESITPPADPPADDSIHSDVMNPSSTPPADPAAAGPPSTLSAIAGTVSNAFNGTASTVKESFNAMLQGPAQSKDAAAAVDPAAAAANPATNTEELTAMMHNVDNKVDDLSNQISWLIQLQQGASPQQGPSQGDGNDFISPQHQLSPEHDISQQESDVLSSSENSSTPSQVQQASSALSSSSSSLDSSPLDSLPQDTPSQVHQDSSLDAPASDMSIKEGGTRRYRGRGSAPRTTRKRTTWPGSRNAHHRKKGNKKHKKRRTPRKKRAAAASSSSSSSPSSSSLSSTRKKYNQLFGDPDEDERMAAEEDFRENQLHSR